MILAGLGCQSVAWADDDDDRHGEPARLEVFFQELFLGQMIHPQEKGEVQLTTGYFSAVETKHDARIPVAIEYGITDSFQIALGLPVDFKRLPERGEGVGNIELEGYWNFYNNPDTGWAYGVGFGLGLPNATMEVGDRAMIYEPFVVACRQYGSVGFNVSAGLEVKDFLDPEGQTEVQGNLALAVYRRFGRFIPLLELSTEIEEQTKVRLAPGIYWRPSWTRAEIGVSLPIGLTAATPDFGVFLLATVEFEPKGRKHSHDNDDGPESERPEPLRAGAADDSPAQGDPDDP